MYLQAEDEMDTEAQEYIKIKLAARKAFASTAWWWKSLTL